MPAKNSSEISREMAGVAGLASGVPQLISQPISQPAIPHQRVSHHLLLCATPTKALCCPDPTVGAASWDTLKRLVRELGLEDPGRPQGIVLRTKADCLRICAEGPVLLIWPEGCVYGSVTPERLERILREHLLDGRPIHDWLVRHYTLSPSSKPAD